MKFNKSLVKYTDKRISNLREILKTKPGHWKPETFHKIRVEIKKIDAVFDVVNFCVGNFQRKKVFRPFKVVFKRAGAIRDLQIEEVLLKKNKIVSPRQQLPVKAGGTVQEKKKLFFKALNKKLFNEILNSKGFIVEFISSMKRNEVNEYFKSGFLEMEILLKKKLNAKQLHRLRKQLKKYYFNLKAININSRMPFTELSRYLDLLGRWHDRRIMLHQLRKTVDARKLTTVKRKHLMELKSKLISQSNRLREMIVLRNKKIIPLIEGLTLKYINIANEGAR